MNHIIERCSPAGAPFVGKCALCGKSSLSLSDVNEACQNVRGLTPEALQFEIDEPARGGNPVDRVFLVAPASPQESDREVLFLRELLRNHRSGVSTPEQMAKAICLWETVPKQAQAETQDDWTYEGGRVNSSQAFLRTCDIVENLIRSDARSLLSGNIGATARLIVGRLAHRHGFAPVLTESEAQ